MSPFPLPVVKIREVSSAMSLKHLPAVLAGSLYCPKRVVPSSGNLEDSIFRSQQGMHCNTTQSTTVKDWIRVLRYTTLLFICLRGGGLPGAATYVTPSLNHAGCVITTSGPESFLFFSFLGPNKNKSKRPTAALIKYMVELVPIHENFVFLTLVIPITTQIANTCNPVFCRINQFHTLTHVLKS